MKTHGFIKDTTGRYAIVRPVSDHDILNAAREIIARKFRRGATITSPSSCIEYLRLHTAMREYEIFSVIFLDNRHRVLACEEMFRGTIDGASVHPREVVVRALQLGAAAVILSHNHPSANPSPSQADQAITRRIQDSCGLVDIRVLDHVIIAGVDTYSFAEQGLL